MDVIKKTTLYYFTGTGNSLMAAKDISKILGNCNLISIALLKDKEEIICDSEKIGIIFPLYFEGLPSVVLDFIERIEIKKVKYIFTVITRGTVIGSGGIFQLRNILNKHGYKLDAGFYLNMPWNYIIMLQPPSIEKQRKIIKKAKNKITKIAECIKDERSTFDKDIMFFMNPLVNKPFVKKVNMGDKNFRVLDSCNSCGDCEKICSVKNITLVNGKPTWSHNCEQCLGCINICPRSSIQFGKTTNYKRRYFNPEIKKEMIFT